MLTGYCGLKSALLLRILRYLIAAVWLVNGLLCKVLLLVPRHAAIVGRILGPAHAGLLTRLIGVGEIGIALWVLNGRKPRWCALAQIILVLVMNALEFWLVPDLLLWGRGNLLFAILFSIVIYLHTFRAARFSPR